MIKNDEKGITMAILVITIIVMLVLAGVSLRAGFGDSGVVEESKNQIEGQKEMKNQIDTEMNQQLDYQEQEWGIK